MFEPSFRTVELEYPEVVSDHRERDVEDGNRTDVPLESARVTVSVHDEIGCVFGDGPGKPVAAEKSENPAWLALECRHRRRVVKQHDPNAAVRNRLQALLERPDFLG